MASKPKKLTYEEIVEKISGLAFTEKSEAKDLVSLINTFCCLQKAKIGSSEDIGSLFDICVSKAGENDWKFLLEVFSRLFYKYDLTKKKPVNTILFGLYKTIVKKFGDVLDENALKNAAVSHDPAAIKDFAKRLERSAKFGEEEFLALLFMLLMLTCNRLSSNRDSDILLIERSIFELYGTGNSKDKYFIKTIVNALKGSNVRSDLYPLVGLYEGASQEILQLEEEREKLSNRLTEQDAKIQSLLSELSALQNKIRNLNAGIDEKDARIVSLENELQEITDRSEYKEILYKKQYETLKKSFVKNLKKSIQLELQGIEDLTESLSDSTRSKIQRRLDNIYKIMQKESE